jgi:hypothetical protein
MKKIIILFTVSIMVFSSASAFGELTDAQKAEQRRQQQAAQSAYEASASAYNEVAAAPKKAAAQVRKATSQTQSSGAGVTQAVRG